MRHEDREAIKMRWDYQFVEMENSYQLILNEEVEYTYPKKRYSKQEAEDEAADVVIQTIKRHGIRNVFYPGTYLQ